jgi:carbon starvation protein
MGKTLIFTHRSGVPELKRRKHRGPSATTSGCTGRPALEVEPEDKTRIIPNQRLLANGQWSGRLVNKLFKNLIWLAVAMLGAWAYVVLAVRRGEPVNSAYVLVAALCSYAIGFRFYSKWIATRVLALDDRRATPCEVHDDGRDFVKTNKWIVFGHHFAAISGPGPLVGPVLAAQFGYLPGALWILIGVVLGGAVQDFVILFCSMRRSGKSLAQMVKEELNSTAGILGTVAILAIMIILLAVLALVVVKALAESPWGVFTVGATVPIAMIMGGYLRWVRVGKVLEASGIGVVLLLLAVWGGQFVHGHAELARVFTLEAEPLAWSIILYGFAASVLPVWLLLAPRDYLSTFMKLGTIFALALGVFLVLPALKFPAVSRFIDGSGPVVAGALFPFCFITIACGAISGFHTLISSGTTPKIITRETYARSIGYGAMCLESLVAIMALIAACSLEPGVYLSMNIKGAPAETAAKVTALGFPVTVDQMNHLAETIGEKTLFGRTGGAATLAVGMAGIFHQAVGQRWLDLWYHFAIMFEALFILTTLDAGTRVGRYLLQDVLGNLWKPLGEVKDIKANVLASGLIVIAWGYFLIQGVRDPLGGINSLWPLFGIANQLLASIALCLATTVILKMTLQSTPGVPPTPLPGEAPAHVGTGKTLVPRSPALALVTLVPLSWLLAVTMTAGVQKIFHSDPRIGFLAAARVYSGKIADADPATGVAKGAEALGAAQQALASNKRLMVNNVLDAVVAGFFLVLVVLIVAISVREWLLLLARKKLAELRESKAVWLPDYAVAEGRPLAVFSLLALALALARELSGEVAWERVEHKTSACGCSLPRDGRDNRVDPGRKTTPPTRGELYVETLEKRYTGINRCC